MKIQLLFFAQARERAGQARATLELPDHCRVSDALALVERTYPGMSELMPHLAVAVNQKLVGPDEGIPDGAEVALLPPVSGGLGARASFRVRPATPERWSDLEQLFGPRGACAGCWCQWPRLRGREFAAGRGAGNRARLRRHVSLGKVPGLIGYLGDQPVAWCAVAPRTEYARLENSRTLAPVDSQDVWSIPCFFVARERRGQGLTVRMLRAAVDHARAQGANVLEGYPVESQGRSADAFVWWGLVGAFRKAGFTEVARRSPTHPVWRRRLSGRGPLVMGGADPTTGPARRTKARRKSNG